MEDIFDSVVNLEEQHINEGYSKGYKAGMNLGKLEGRDVGLKTGFETGEELGFYRGCISVWMSAIEIDPTTFSPRIQKHITQLHEILSGYPLLDPQNESVGDIIESLRSKFRAICATLSIHLEYPGYPTKNQDVEF